jgi:EAL and modified HD-GYP domain-containing signal transduction protein|tara:strand:+ start:50778 stop:51791 length:1014 start_codon:yes stop_codon:yes gene_type:complete
LLSQFGIQQILGIKLGFLSIAASSLMSDIIELLPAERMVLEILEDIPINAQIITRCKALKDLGFKLAIVDYANRPEHMVLLPHVDYVEIGLSTTSIEETSDLVTLVRKQSPAKIVAERVEEEALFLACQELKFDAYQGYFFAQPSILTGEQAQPNQMCLMRMIDLLLGDADLSELEALFKNSPGLTLGLLKLVNSVGVNGGSEPIESIRQVIVMLGQKQMLRWVQPLMYATPSSGASDAIMSQVAGRARLMELIAKKVESYQQHFSDQVFMVGMLSLADTVVASPMEQILNDIGLSDNIKQAILRQTGVHGQLLKLAKDIELCNFDAAQYEINALNI